MTTAKVGVTTAHIAVLCATAQEATASADPHVLSTWLLEHTSAEQQQFLLERALPDYIRRQVARPPAERVAVERTTPTAFERRQAYYRSQRLNQSMFATGSWKQLRVCDVFDVRDLAARRYDKAAQLQAEAVKWSELAEFMAANNKRIVGDLTDEEIDKYL